LKLKAQRHSSNQQQCTSTGTVQLSERRKSTWWKVLGEKYRQPTTGGLRIRNKELSHSLYSLQGPHFKFKILCAVSV